MRYMLSSILATLTISAFASAAPAAAQNAGDANGMREQAQTHPNEANQDPDYTSSFVAEGEVYPPWAVSNGHFVRSSADVAVASSFASNCRTYRTDYGGWTYTECGPQ